MSTRYVVKRGDNLSRIASTFHLRSWAEVYNDLQVMDPEPTDKGGGLLTRPLTHYASRDFVGLLWAR